MGVNVVPVQTRWGGFINYCYLLVDKDAGEAALVDPSWNYERIVSVLDAQGVRLRYVLVTHSHVDHINLVRRFAERFRALVVLSEAEHDQSGFGGPQDRYVRDGELLPLGQGNILCMVTPGHTSGSTCYLWEGNLFTGDTLFPDGCGICPSYAAAGALFESIRRILSVVDPSTRLYSGHCYHVANGITFERAMKTNIYLQIESREAFCGFRMRRGQKNLFAFGSLACEGPRPDPRGRPHLPSKRGSEMKRVFLYAGQGSQYYQMGRELYDGDPAFRAAFDRYDAFASVYRRTKLATVIYAEDRRACDPFDAIEDTHFAIPVIQLALTEMLDFKGYTPDIVIGTSLGEYVALVVAGQLSAEALFEMLALQISLLRSEFGNGRGESEQGMVSVFVKDGSESDSLAPFDGSFAGRVGEDTIVFSGLRPTLDRIMGFCRLHGLLAQKLSVPYAFHNVLMDRIRPRFLVGCPEMDGRGSSITHVTCLVGPESREGRGRLFDILRYPFDFHEAFMRLDKGESYHVSDLSPAGIFTRPLKASFEGMGLHGSQVVPLLSIFGSDMERLSAYQRGGSSATSAS